VHGVCRLGIFVAPVPSLLDDHNLSTAVKLTPRTVPSLAIVAGIAALAACADPSRPTTPLSPEATLDATADRVVPPMPELASVTDIGEVVQNAKILGRDGAISTRAFGVSLWTFGDTPLSVPNARGQNWSDNTISWSTDTDASDGITLNHDYLDAVGAPGEFIPYTAAESTYNYQHDPKHCTAQPCGAEYAFWPAGPVYDQARNRVLVPYYKLHRISGQAAWTGIGSWSATRSSPTAATRTSSSSGARSRRCTWRTC
jgi:hypothetical protein